jgi:hypothetical protein
MKKKAKKGETKPTLRLHHSPDVELLVVHIERKPPRKR